MIIGRYCLWDITPNHLAITNGQKIQLHCVALDCTWDMSNHLSQDGFYFVRSKYIEQNNLSQFSKTRMAPTTSLAPTKHGITPLTKVQRLFWSYLQIESEFCPAWALPLNPNNSSEQTLYLSRSCILKRIFVLQGPIRYHHLSKVRWRRRRQRDTKLNESSRSAKPTQIVSES